MCAKHPRKYVLIKTYQEPNILGRIHRVKLRLKSHMLGLLNDVCHGFTENWLVKAGSVTSFSPS